MSTRRQREKRRLEKIAYMERLKAAKEWQRELDKITKSKEGNSPYDSMTKAELLEEGKKNGLIINRNKTKAEILAIVKEELEG